MKKRHYSKKNARIHLGGLLRVPSKNQARAKGRREKHCRHLKPCRNPFEYAQLRAKRSIHEGNERSTR